MRKGLIDKWAFPCNLFNLSSLQKTGHEKTLLTRSLAAVFADTMANVLDFIAKGEYKVFTGKALLRFEKNNASRLSVCVWTYRLTNAAVCVLKQCTTKIKSISMIRKEEELNGHNKQNSYSVFGL